MVPKRLKEARLASGFSQEKLAQLIDVEGLNPRSRLSSYEVGRSEPPFKLIVKIAKLLDYPENYFYTRDDGLADYLLLIHRKQRNPETNPQFESLTEAKKLAEKLDEVKKLIVQIDEDVKRIKKVVG